MDSPDSQLLANPCSIIARSLVNKHATWSLRVLRIFEQEYESRVNGGTVLSFLLG